MKPVLALLAALSVAVASPATFTTITIPRPIVSAIPALKNTPTTADLPVTASKESRLIERRHNSLQFIAPTKWAPPNAATTNSERESTKPRTASDSDEMDGVEDESTVQQSELTEEQEKAVAAGETVVVSVWVPRETETVTVTVTVSDAVPIDDLD